MYSFESLILRRWILGKYWVLGPIRFDPPEVLVQHSEHRSHVGWHEQCWGRGGERERGQGDGTLVVKDKVDRED